MNARKSKNFFLLIKTFSFFDFLICFLVSDTCFQLVDFLFLSCQTYILTIAQYTPIVIRQPMHIHPYLTHNNEWVKSTVLSAWEKSNANHYKPHDMDMFTQWSEWCGEIPHKSIQNSIYGHVDWMQWDHESWLSTEDICSAWVLMTNHVLSIVFFEIGQLEWNTGDNLIVELWDKASSIMIASRWDQVAHSAALRNVLCNDFLFPAVLTIIVSVVLQRGFSPRFTFVGLGRE
jgi:hypothetical protein